MFPGEDGSQDKEKFRVLLVDDNSMARQSLSLLINHEPDLIVTGQAGTGGMALEEIKSDRPDIIVIDISLPDMNWIDLIKDIRLRQPGQRILVIAMHDGNFYARQVLEAGAKGYIAKDEAADEVIPAIRHIVNGGIYLSQN